MKFFTVKKLIFYIGALSLCAAHSPLRAQTVELPALVTGEELQSIKGSTLNRNSSEGGSSSLTVGSSTTFGASVNVNASPGTSGSSKSTLKLNELGADPDGSLQSLKSCPTGGCLRSSVGGNDSTLSGSITNLRATDAVEFNGIDVNTGANTFGGGVVNFTGISGENTLVLDPTSQFNAETTTSPAEDGTNNNDTKVSSAAASATIETSTETDIKSSNFVSTFQQAF